MVLLTPAGRVLFVAVPRTGGTAIAKTFLRDDQGVKRSTAGGGGWEPHEDSGDPEWPTAVHRLRHHYRGRFVFAFSVVRHPVAWFESYFRYRTQTRWESVEGNSPARPGPWVLDPCRADTFAAFVSNYLATMPGAYSRLVERVIGPAAAPLVDHVCRLETVEDDRPTLEAQAGLSLRPVAPANVSDTTAPTEWGPGQRVAVLAAEAAVVGRFYPGSA